LTDRGRILGQLGLLRIPLQRLTPATVERRDASTYCPVTIELVVLTAAGARHYSRHLIEYRQANPELQLPDIEVTPTHSVTDAVHAAIVRAAKTAADPVA
jgi:hypothetical protein